MDQRIIDLYDSFTHGHIHRREFLDRLSELAGSTAAAAALLSLLQCDYASAATVPENDPRLAIARTSYDSSKGTIRGYLARAKGTSKRPAVIVIHQNRGLNPHIEDVARRVALEGFLAFAPDLLSVSGGTPPSDDEARDLHAKTDREAMVAAAIAAAPYMKTHPESTGKVGAVGFCFGGGVVNRMAAGDPDLAAAVAYYGAQIPAGQVPAIKAALLLHYAEHDDGINRGIAAYEGALKADGKRYAIYTYPGTQHAFNDDTAGVRYNKQAADLAWQRTLAFFREHLGSPPKT
ncbi:MAG TPA: dienelactone hydrolase family protein [Xanthobacteraceae bacterium]|nr:dienelactone hydrolase family protein [Xanthobacteraceae bacterium]